MRYTVSYTRHAERSLKKLPKDVQIRILDSMDALSENPYAHMKQLKGERTVPLYSHRVGGYRIIFRLVNDMLLILVLEIGDRKNVYDEF